MPERNLCLETGCKAACCRNMRGYLTGGKEFFQKLFPDSIEVSTGQETIQKITNQEPGVYFYTERGRVYFSISGDCPNLDEDFNCKKHGKRFYPGFCSNMVFGSVSCQDAKEILKLNSLTPTLS
jgi:hypothetical protein